MASSGFSYKTIVPQNSLTGPQGHIINNYLRLSGSHTETNNDPITKLTDWAAYCYDLDLKNKVNNGTTCYVGVRWTFANSGQEIRLIGDNNDRIEVTCRDDLTDLAEHRFLIQGYKETSQY